MIRSFSVAGFKPFGKRLDVPLAPLTIVVGPNGSGKTSLFEAMGLLAQSVLQRGLRWTSRTDQRTGWTDDAPDWVRLPEPPACLHGGRDDADLILGLDLDPVPADAEPFTTEPIETGPLHYRLAWRKVGSWEEWEHWLRWGKVDVQRTSRIKSRSPGGASYRREFRIGGTVAGPNPVGSDSDVLSPDIFQTVGGDAKVDSTMQRAQAGALLGAQYLRRRFSYVGTERGPRSVLREVETGLPVPRSVGKRGQFAVQRLARLFASDESADAAQAIRRWTERFGLARLSAGWRGGKRLGCDFRDPLSGAVLSFDMAGYGSQQLLPIIVELFSSPVPSTILIEEPEMSLHPKAAAHLPVMLAESVRKGRQVVVSTHSELLLQDLHLAVGKEGLPASSIRVIEFERDKTGVVVQELKLSRDGLIEGWVPSFVEAEQTSAKAWVPKVRKRM